MRPYSILLFLSDLYHLTQCPSELWQMAGFPFLWQHFICIGSADGYLGCFPVLTIVNNGSMNLGMQISSKIVFFFC